MSTKENNGIYKTTTRLIIQIAVILLIVLNFNSFINLIKFIWGIISPLFLGAGIAFVLNIIVNRYERIYFPNSNDGFILKTRRTVCIFLSLLTVVLVLFLFLYILIPQISNFVHLLSTQLPTMYEKSVEWIMGHSEKYPIIRQRIKELDISGEAAINKSLEIMNSWAFGSVSFIGIVFGKIIELVLALVFSIYILFDKNTVKKNYQKLSKTYLSSKKREQLTKIIKITDDTFSSFFLGQFKEAVILGILCTIGMIILRLPYPTTIGSVVGLSSIIPMVGAYIGAAFGILLIIVVDWFSAVLFLAFIIILQQIESNFIYPKIVGDTIGLPGIWVFAAIIVGTGLMGFLGILLGVPIVATLYKLLNQS